MIDDKEYVNKLLRSSDDYLQVFFERPSGEIVSRREAYRYLNFSHIGLHLPRFGVIWESLGSGFSFPQESSDHYLPKNCVKVILPIHLEDDVEQINKVIEESIGQYGNCVPFVVNVLKKLSIIDKNFATSVVDDVYFALRGNVFNPKLVVEYHRNLTDHSEKEETKGDVDEV